MIASDGDSTDAGGSDSGGKQRCVPRGPEGRSIGEEVTSDWSGSSDSEETADDSATDGEPAGVMAVAFELAPTVAVLTVDMTTSGCGRSCCNG